MKKAVFITICALALVATGCSSSTPQTTAPTAASPVAQTDEINPELKNVKFVREQLTDPDLYSFKQSNNFGTSVGSTSNLNSDEQKKVGLTTKFSRSSKYGIEGIAKIVSADTVRLDSFSYNGGCGNLIIALTNQNNLQNYVAKIKTISTPVSAASYDIPISISLIKFDSISAYCPENEDPVSTASF